MKMGRMLIDDLDHLSIKPRDSARILKNRFYIGEFWAVRSIFTSTSLRFRRRTY